MPKGKILMGKRPVKPGPVKPKPKGGKIEAPDGGGNYENNLNTSPKKRPLPVPYDTASNPKKRALPMPKPKPRPVRPGPKGKTKPVMPRRAGK